MWKIKKLNKCHEIGNMYHLDIRNGSNIHTIHIFIIRWDNSISGLVNDASALSSSGSIYLIYLPSAISIADYTARLLPLRLNGICHIQFVRSIPRLKPKEFI